MTRRKKVLFSLLFLLGLATVFGALNLIPTIASPYGWRESCYWLFKYATGLKNHHAGLVEPIAHSCSFDDVTARYTLIFVGDIMPGGNSPVRAGEQLKEFLSDGDYYIANFEGVISESKKNALLLVSDRRHSSAIIASLKNIFPAEKTFLCLANNHAADFGREEFLKSARMLESNGFRVFGHRQKPYADINEEIRVTAGTMWSNRSADFLAGFDEAQRYCKPGAFNIFYPHWGYEFELSPRPAMLERAAALAQYFDALIGHHPHCPQPVALERTGEKPGLVAYSLGNFLGGRLKKHYRYGIVLKARVGPDKEGRWALAAVEWRLIQLSRGQDGGFVVEVSDEPFFL